MEERPLKYLRLTAVLTAIVLFVVACGGGGASPTADESAEESADATASQAAEMPEELVIGFVPSREADALVETIQPVADALSEALGIPVEGVVTSDYTGLVTAMESDQAQIGAFGPFSLLQARDRADAEIILQSERFGSATYHTQFMTNNPDKYCEDEPVAVPTELESGTVDLLYCNGTDTAEEGPASIEALSNMDPGTTVSFVEQASASGYIFPATIFIQQGFDIEADVDPVFAGAHDASTIAVCDGTAEVGVSFDDARGDAIDAGAACDVAANVVVFALGPEIPNDGWAVSGDLPDETKEAIKQALLDYAATDEGVEVLESIYNITGLVEADQEAFSIVEDAAAELGIEGD
jgi:phosphonate transport system substrate-binding protein